MKHTLLTLTTAYLAFGIGFAQAQTTPPMAPAKSAAECQGVFKAADKNNDGSLDKAEIDASQIAIPTTLATQSPIGMQAFLSACSEAAGQAGPKK